MIFKAVIRNSFRKPIRLTNSCQFSEFFCAYPRQTESDHQRYLFQAVSDGDDEALSHMLESGLNPDSKNEEVKTIYLFITQLIRMI